NYKGKMIVMEEEPNDEWENPINEDNLILGNYVMKWLSDGPRGTNAVEMFVILNFDWMLVIDCCWYEQIVLDLGKWER
ncbi:hypothetical protein Tco_1011317, partial [Tanacetum coccineum]